MSERPDPHSPFDLAPNSQRLAALASYDILDTPAEQSFDDIVQLASLVCAAPVALVSLVAGDRQWFKAKVGFPLPETDLERSVCRFVVAEPDLLVIPDLAADPRTAHNPLVTGEPHIRFYAGAPLRTADGQGLGSLCVIDHQPRPGGLTSLQADALRRLARQVMAQLDSRRARSERDTVLATQDAELRRERRLEALAEASAALQTSDDPNGLVIALLTGESAGLGFEQSYTYDLAPDGQHLQLTHAIGVPEAQQAPLRHISTSVPLCGIVAETGRPLILADLQANSEPRYQVGRAAGLHAFAAYPIISQGQLSGVISFGSARQRAFDAEALHFFATIARFLSIGRERVATERRLQEAVTQLEATANDLRQAQEAGGVGLFMVSLPDNTLYPTPEFCRIYGLAVAESYPAKTIEDQVLPEDRGLMSTGETRNRGELVQQVEYRVRHPDGSVHWVARTGRIELDASGQPRRFTGTARDITEARTAREALTRSEERYRLLFDTIDAGFCTFEMIYDAAGQPLDYRFIEVNPAFVTQTGLTDAVGQTIRTLVPTHEQVWFDRYGEVARTGIPAAFEDRAEGLGRDYEIAAFRIGPPEDHQVGALFRDVSERRRAEERQQLLNRELSHRLKNTLSMVQAIATQTLRNAPDPMMAREALAARLIALGKAHDILMTDNGQRDNADLREIVQGAIALHDDQTRGRFIIDGPPVDCSARPALSVALMLHELATNATKYGALSTAGGRVRITWQLDNVADQETLTLVWAEEGGPPVVAPTRQGFGTKLIERGLAGAVGGKVETRYLPNGLVCTLTAPAAGFRIGY